MVNKHIIETKNAVNEYTEGFRNKLMTEAEEKQTQSRADRGRIIDKLRIRAAGQVGCRRTVKNGQVKTQ